MLNLLSSGVTSIMKKFYVLKKFQNKTSRILSVINMHNVFSEVSEMCGQQTTQGKIKCGVPAKILLPQAEFHKRL